MTCAKSLTILLGISTKKIPRSTQDLFLLNRHIVKILLCHCFVFLELTCSKSVATWHLHSTPSSSHCFQWNINQFFQTEFALYHTHTKQDKMQTTENCFLLLCVSLIFCCASAFQKHAQKDSQSTPDLAFFWNQMCSFLNILLCCINMQKMFMDFFCTENIPSKTECSSCFYWAFLS